MIRTMCVAAAALLCAASASAQQAPLTDAQQDEMFCVYDAVADNGEADRVALSYLDGSRTREEQAAGRALVDARADACGTKYGWNGDQKGTAWLIGLHNTLLDIMIEAVGLSEEEENMFGDVLDNLPPEDLKIFFDGGWGDNTAFVSRIKEKIKATDFSDDDADLSDAMVILDSMIVLAAAQDEWVRMMKR